MSSLDRKSIKIITETKPLGPVVVASIVEYTDQICHNQVFSSMFEVQANRINESGGELAECTITRVTNNEPVLTDEPTNGEYVVIELHSNDINPITIYHKVTEWGGFNYNYELEYTVI